MDPHDRATSVWSRVAGLRRRKDPAIDIIEGEIRVAQQAVLLRGRAARQGDIGRKRLRNPKPGEDGGRPRRKDHPTRNRRPGSIVGNPTSITLNLTTERLERAIALRGNYHLEKRYPEVSGGLAGLEGGTR